MNLNLDRFLSLLCHWWTPRWTVLYWKKRNTKYCNNLINIITSNELQEYGTCEYVWYVLIYLILICILRRYSRYVLLWVQDRSSQFPISLNGPNRHFLSVRIFLDLYQSHQTYFLMYIKVTNSLCRALLKILQSKKISYLWQMIGQCCDEVHTKG